MRQKKRSYQELADEYGLTLDMIKKLVREKVNVYDPLEVVAARKAKRSRIAPDAELKKPDDFKGDIQTLAGLKKLLLTTGDLETAKIIKEKSMAFKNLISAEREEGNLVKISEVDERDTRIAAAVRAMVSKWRNDLPPKLTGLSEVEIQQIMLTSEKELLAMLADEQSEFWKERERPKKDE